MLRQARPLRNPTAPTRTLAGTPIREKNPSAVVAPVEYHRTIAADEVRFVLLAKLEGDDRSPGQRLLRSPAYRLLGR